MEMYCWILQHGYCKKNYPTVTGPLNHSIARKQNIILQDLAHEFHLTFAMWVRSRREVKLHIPQTAKYSPEFGSELDPSI